MAEEKNRGLRFSHLYLENWRNFSLVDVDLGRRVFLVGPNASGKSNFLDVFRFLRDLVGIGGGLQAAVQHPSRGGVSRIRCLAARQHPDIGIRVHLGDEDEPSLWEYELKFGQDNLRRPIVKRERVLRNQTELLLRPNAEDEKDPERLTQTHLEQINVNQEYRAIADFLKTVRYLHIVPQLVREPDRSVGRKNDPFGGDFLEQIVRTPEKTRKSRLKKILGALKIAVPQLEELQDFRDERGTPHLKGKYSHWRPQGAWQTEEQFSDGTLRLMGLLWAILEGGGPLLLEEPELSLHQEVVRYIPQMFAKTQRRTGRQVLVSTHSANLLQDEGVGMDEVFLLRPEKEGTSVIPAGGIPDVKKLLEGGFSMAEATLPFTQPERVNQLPLFGE